MRYPLGGLDDRNQSAQDHPEELTSQRFEQGSRIMTTTSIGRIVVPSLGLVAACGAVLFVGITHMRRGPPVETRAATAAPAVSPPASGARDESPAALATVQSEANAVGAALAVSPSSPETDEAVPAFDIARIEQTGDAVIAGRAAPGAIVELLRNGEPHDPAVADQSGQFVMDPPRRPAPARSNRAPRCRSMFQRRWGQTVPRWIRPSGLLKRSSPPSLPPKLRSE